MSWTTPKTWTTGELVTAGDLNTHLRDQLEALKDPPTHNHAFNESADYTTTSTAFVDVDATNLALSLTTGGGDVLIGFVGTLTVSVDIRVYFNVEIDGTPLAGDDGIMLVRLWAASAGNRAPVCFVVWKEGLAAGEHTIKLQWKVSSGGTATLYAGAGTSNYDVHGQFWAREVS